MCQDDRPDDAADVPDPSLADTGIWPAISAPKAPTSEPIAEDAQEPAVDGPAMEMRLVEPPRKEPLPEAPINEFGPRLLAAISQLNQSFDRRLGALETVFDREVRAEATRERIVDRLHAELQEYKQDLLLKVQRPIFIDLIQLHDDLGKMIDALPLEDVDRAEALRGTLDSIRTAIEDILYRQGVEPFRADTNEFDPRRQRAVGTVPTEDPEQNKTIAARVRPGFQAGEKLIRPEIVSVFTLRK
jgi:molecular chaperone GrpE